MASIMTNAATLTALQSLNSNLDVTQSRISTGDRVALASDDAAYRSIASTMRSDYKALSSVRDALDLGASTVDIACTGMQKAIDTVNDIKVKLIAANGASSVDKARIDVEIRALQGRLKSDADAATFSGANWLSVDTTRGHTGTFNDVKIVSAFNRSASGSILLGTIDIKVQDIKLYDARASATGLTGGILDTTRNAAGVRATTSAATLGTYAGSDTFSVASFELTNGTLFANDQQVTQMIGVVEGALKEMTTAATNLEAARSLIDLQKTFTLSLMDSIERGIGQLVDADMNKVSTRLQALQAQQKLGIRSRSIANGNAKSILSLFR